MSNNFFVAKYVSQRTQCTKYFRKLYWNERLSKAESPVVSRCRSVDGTDCRIQKATKLTLIGTKISFVVPDYASELQFQYAGVTLIRWIAHLLVDHGRILNRLRVSFSTCYLNAKSL